MTRYDYYCDCSDDGSGSGRLSKLFVPIYGVSTAATLVKQSLTNWGDGFKTVRESEMGENSYNYLHPVFENGVILQQDTFETIRARARAN